MTLRNVVLQKKEGGSALFIALGVITIMSILGIAFMKLSVSETQSVSQQTLAQKAFYIAETGAQRAIRELDNNEDWTGVTNIPFGSGKYSVQVSTPDADGIQTITSSGKVGRLTKKVEVKVKRVEDVHDALFYCQFGNDRVTMHADDPDRFGMRVHGHTWCNRDVRLDEGARHWGDISANNVRIGDISEGWSPKMTVHDSCIVYGDVIGADIENMTRGYILARSPDTLYELDSANGDATTMDAYWKDTLGNCYDKENSNPVVNSGYIQGAIREFTTGSCPGESTFSTIPYPMINYDTLKAIAIQEGHFFSKRTDFYTFLRTLPNYVASGPDTVRKIWGKVFYVDDNNLTVLADQFNERNSFDVRACLYTKGGLDIGKAWSTGLRYTHIAPDSFPALVTHGDIFIGGQGSDPCDPPCPAYIEGLIYTEADDLDNPWADKAGQVHLHHHVQADSIVLKGAVIANYPHDCVKITVLYDPKVRWTNWLFSPAGGNDTKIQVVSWRQLKRG